MGAVARLTGVIDEWCWPEMGCENACLGRCQFPGRNAL